MIKPDNRRRIGGAWRGIAICFPVVGEGAVRWHSGSGALHIRAFVFLVVLQAVDVDAERFIGVVAEMHLDTIAFHGTQLRAENAHPHGLFNLRGIGGIGILNVAIFLIDECLSPHAESHRWVNEVLSARRVVPFNLLRGEPIFPRGGIDMRRTDAEQQRNRDS